MRHLTHFPYRLKRIFLLVWANSLVKKLQLIFSVIIVGVNIVMLLGWCGWFLLVYPTPREALTGQVGYLKPDQYLPETVQVLHQQPLGRNLLLFYGWQSPASQVTNQYCLATTYVEQQWTVSGRGWRPVSSFFYVSSTAAPTYGRTVCTIAANEFIARYSIYDDQTIVSGVSGLGQVKGRGEKVRVIWPDGRIDVVPLQNKSFFLARSGEWERPQFELLAATGQVLERQE